jgi:hypothetical protein
MTSREGENGIEFVISKRTDSENTCPKERNPYYEPMGRKNMLILHFSHDRFRTVFSE